MPPSRLPMTGLPTTGLPTRGLEASTDWSRIVASGQKVMQAEIDAIQSVALRLDATFAEAVRMLLDCCGTVVVSGMGKAGIIGQKLAASLSSTGTPSYFMHPAEAVHGDLGSIRNSDVVIFLSYSGETDEVTRLSRVLKSSTTRTLAITSHDRSTLATDVDLTLQVGMHKEACSLNLAPSCSTTAMLALGDALALVVSEQRGFSKEDFAKFHPGGGLGKQLTRVEEVMRPLTDCRVAQESQTVRQVLIQVGRSGRRTGAIMLTDSQGKLAGIFTDSDLARLLESSHEFQLDESVANVMTRKLQTVTQGCYLPEAMRSLARRKLSELPVVNSEYRPVGILDITDIMSVMSEAWANEACAASGPTPTAEILSIEAHRQSFIRKAQ